MRTFITVSKAEEEIKWLQNYITLVENYEANTVEKLIVKEYAYLGSAQRVADELNRRKIKISKRNVIQQDVTGIIRSQAKDELHKIIKQGFNYKYRTRNKR